MKIFLRDFLIFISIASAAFLSLLSIARESYSSETNYLASIIDKHKRLEQFDGNRLLLVGDSNLAFGINSELLEKEFNVNVVNLGLHGGLGAELILNEAISAAKQGDIVLVSLGYELYGNYAGELGLINIIQKIYPKSEEYRTLSFKDKLLISSQKIRTRISLEQLFNEPQVLIDSVYNRKSFNKYGDEIGHLTKYSKTELGSRSILTKFNINEICGNLLIKLNIQCNTIGAKLYIMFPPYAISQYNINKETITDLSQQLKTNFSCVKLLNQPESFVYNDSLFYDTVYHLNGTGRQMRTLKLIELLKSSSVL